MGTRARLFQSLGLHRKRVWIPKSQFRCLVLDAFKPQNTCFVLFCTVVIVGTCTVVVLFTLSQFGGLSHYFCAVCWWCLIYPDPVWECCGICSPSPPLIRSEYPVWTCKGNQTLAVARCISFDLMGGLVRHVCCVASARNTSRSGSRCRLICRFDGEDGETVPEGWWNAGENFDFPLEGWSTNQR